MERLGPPGFGSGSVLLVFLTSALLCTADLRICSSCKPHLVNCVSNQCFSNCSESTVCVNERDVCAAVWWRDAGPVMMETLCHDPLKLLHDVMLRDYFSSECVLQEQHVHKRHMRVCGCTKDQCNQNPLLHKLTEQEKLSKTNSSRGFKLNQNCKFCDVESSVCNASGVCESACIINAICETPDEVCASAWRSNGGNSSIETVCHNPALLFHGHNLTDSQSSVCQMKKVEEDLYICSCNDEECNDRLVFNHDLEQSPEVVLFNHPSESSWFSLASVLISVFVLITIVLLSVFYCYYMSQHKLKLPNKKSLDSERCNIFMNPEEHSDSSSANANSLNHNTELLPIQLDRVVGKGRFADVYKAKLKQSADSFQTVAVKIFPYEEFSSWKSEWQIFSDVELRHENVLQFLTAEERMAERQYWLITAYHERGNLQELLVLQVIGWDELCRLSVSLARGVAHLHSDRTPCGRAKVSIAHRDLKSSNVLVKSDWSCCVCDFGLSLRLDSCLSPEELANSGQVGTARYMAPEVLESRMDLENTESFKQADVYSMALVLWEIMSRCSATGDVRDYEPPFGKLKDHPCVESMKDDVIRDRLRPEIPTSWSKHAGVHHLSSTIEECWDHDPEARLTAQCVVERFDDIISSDVILPISPDTKSAGDSGIQEM
ncbi:TGF-beta receptor type-2 [Danio aesculapii]|uniref:TGF-beta receptor type-2 n=1 Tax=Danio aesculapii TaxID=1142201 RepID=UPI0024C00C77|nr:TGF-beta receptor type-2 [Danio aesculapii]